MTDDERTAKLAFVDREIEDLTKRLIEIASEYDGVDLTEAAQLMTIRMDDLETNTRLGLAAGVAFLALRLHRGNRPAFIQRLSEDDRRLNVTGNLHAVVSNFGGERLVADNPAMPRMVEQLADAAEELARAGFLPDPGTPA